MPTTPISVSTGLQGYVNTTLYTVPVGKTAIVKAVISQGANNGSYAHTISKSINGQNFPLNYNQASYNTPATGATQITGANLISAPITLGSGESLKAYVSTGGVYNFPSVVTNTNQSYAADGSLATIYAMKYGNGVYMAVGSSNAGCYVATSPDCVTWTQKTSAVGLAGNMDYIEYTNGIWVGIRQAFNGSVFFSTDNGNTWAYATGLSTVSPQSIYVGNNTFVLMASDNVYYSTNGSTWTAASNLTALLAIAGDSLLNVGWTGSHWVVNGYNGNLATTDFITWKGLGSLTGNVQNYTNTSYSNNEYSSYHSKYFSVRAVASTNNVFSSSDGLLWDAVGSLASTMGKVAVAGNNQVLIGCPSGGGTTRYKSTNGTTWTSGTDSQGYGGKVWGLDNGYFLTFQNTTAGNCYLSTDPITGAGTTIGGGSAADFSARSAAADPITGKWCALGKDSGSNRWLMLGGTSGTNIGTVYNPSINVTSTFGNPMAVAWSAADSAFYAVSDTGQVRRATDYNSTWTLVNSDTIINQYNAGYSYAIKVVGTSIYVFPSTNTTYSTYFFLGSTLNSGSSFTSYNYAGAGSYGAAYWRPFWLNPAGIYQGGDTQVATNGTYLMLTTGTGQVTGFNPSAVATQIITPPTVFGTMQQVNGYTITYGGYHANFTNMSGFYFSTNVVTTYGVYNVMNGNLVQSPRKAPNKILYLGGKYYINAFGAVSMMFSGTTLANTDTGLGVGSTIAGVTVVQPDYGFATDGTNMVGWNTRIGNTMNTTTPASFVYAATISASIVEIS